VVVGIHFAKTEGSASSPPLLSVNREKRGGGKEVMREVKRVLMLALMGLVLSVGGLVPMTAFGQKNNNRPPKEPEKVKQPEKQPRGDSNSQGNTNRHGRQ
jgi:hypothetical protein